MWFIRAVVIALMSVSACCAQTVLSKVAGTITPGTFVRIDNASSPSLNGFASGSIFQSTLPGSILEFNDKQPWNPITKQIMYFGFSHPSSGSPNCGNIHGLVVFDDASSTLSATDLLGAGYCTAFNEGTAIHAYEHNSIDLATGNLFHATYGPAPSGTGMIELPNGASPTNPASYVLLPHWNVAGENGSNGNCYGQTNNAGKGSAYFPDRNSIIVVDGQWGVHELPFSGSNTNGTPATAWTVIANTAASNCGAATTLTGLGIQPNLAQYSPLCHCVWVGGGNGSTATYEYFANGTWSSLITAPFNMAPGNNVAIVALDPNSGRFVLTNCNSGGNGEMWSFDPQTKISTDLGIQAPGPIWNGTDCSESVATSISTYGIIVYTVANSSPSGSNSQIYAFELKNKADGDWIMRSEATGVFLANPLSTQTNIGCATNCSPPNQGDYGKNFGNCCANVGATTMLVADTLNYPANGGSMKCAVPVAFSGDQPCSQFFQNFAPSNGGSPSFTDGGTFYVQAMFWIPQAAINDMAPGGGGQKLLYIASPDPATCNTGSTSTCATSCTPNEIITLNQSYRGNPYAGFAQVYSSCDVFQPVQTPVVTSWNANNYLDQTGISTCYQYPNPANGGAPATFFPPYQGCVPFPVGQWFSIEWGITLGPYTLNCTFQGSTIDNCQQNSTLNIWQAPLGQPYTQIFSGTTNLYNGTHLTYGKLWIAPWYNTGAGQWTGGYNLNFAELIGSTNFVAAPGVAQGPTNAPIVSLAPSSVVFGSQGINSPTAPQTETLTNTGTATLNITSITVSGTNSADFVVSANTCGSTLAVSTGCTLNVAFTPSILGAETANLVYTTNASSSPNIVPLSGSGFQIAKISGSGVVIGTGTVKVVP